MIKKLMNKTLELTLIYLIALYLLIAIIRYIIFFQFEFYPEASDLISAYKSISKWSWINIDWSVFVFWKIQICISQIFGSNLNDIRRILVIYYH